MREPDNILVFTVNQAYYISLHPTKRNGRSRSNMWMMQRLKSLKRQKNNRGD